MEDRSEREKAPLIEYRVKVLFDGDDSFTVVLVDAPDLAQAAAEGVARAQAGRPDCEMAELLCYPTGGKPCF